MFETLISGAIDPEAIKYLRLIKQALDGVQSRLVAQDDRHDPLAQISAKVQLDAIAAWAPAVDEMLAALETKPAPAVHAVPHPAGSHQG